MKLKIKKRDGKVKSELSKLRHEQDIPAVVYAKGHENQLIAVDGAEFHAALRSIVKGHLPTTIFELELDGKPVKAIIKDIQYHRTTYRVIHLDFMILQDKVPVSVNVPVEYANEANCEGVKLGGSIRPILRHVKVSCLPKDIPAEFVLDVAHLGIGKSLLVSNIEMDKAVKPVIGLKNVVVTVGKR